MLKETEIAISALITLKLIFKDEEKYTGKDIKQKIDTLIERYK